MDDEDITGYDKYTYHLGRGQVTSKTFLSTYTGNKSQPHKFTT